MEVTLEKKHDNRIEFWTDGISTSFANVVRRYAMAYIPIFALDTITFYDNTSSVWDEYLAHRLGQFPIVTPEKTQEGAEVVFSLDATGPTVIHSKDFKSSDKEVVIAREDLVLIRLAANQHLRLEAKAIVGTVQSHAKYQPGIVSYGVENGKLKFMVESFYQMPPKRMITEAVDMILDILDEIEDVVVKGKKKTPKKETKKEEKPKKKTEKKTTKKEEKPKKTTKKKETKKSTKKKK